MSSSRPVRALVRPAPLRARHGERVQDRPLHRRSRSGPGSGSSSATSASPTSRCPAHIRDEVKRQLDLDMTHYCDPQGILPLREAIARTMGERRGLEITPDRVVVFPGAQAADRLLPGGLLRSRRRGHLPEPGLPDLRVVHALSRRRRRCRCTSTRRTGSAFSGEDARAAHHAAHQADLPQLPVEPDGRRRHARAARGDRRRHPSQGAAGRARLLGRGLRGHPLRRREAPLDRLAARHGGADDHRRRRLEDLLAGPAAASAGRSSRPPRRRRCSRT